VLSNLIFIIIIPIPIPIPIPHFSNKRLVSHVSLGCAGAPYFPLLFDDAKEAIVA